MQADPLPHLRNLPSPAVLCQCPKGRSQASQVNSAAALVTVVAGTQIPFLWPSFTFVHREYITAHAGPNIEWPARARPPPSIALYHSCMDLLRSSSPQLLPPTISLPRFLLFVFLSHSFSAARPSLFMSSLLPPPPPPPPPSSLAVTRQSPLSFDRPGDRNSLRHSVRVAD